MKCVGFMMHFVLLFGIIFDSRWFSLDNDIQLHVQKTVFRKGC